jgi:type IX secretion system PorP/SprF family membrane protein
MLKHLRWLLLLVPSLSWAQDPQFSQYYANPLYLNPALTGNIPSARAGLSYRTQWPQLDQASFDTYTFYYDQFLQDYDSGIGLLLMHDRQGVVGLSSTSAHANYAYQLPLSNGMTLRPGISVGVIQRAVNTANLRWADQFSSGGFTQPTQEDLGIFDPIYQFDVSLGGMLYTPQWWLGASWSHLNQPDYSYGDNTGNGNLPYKISLHGGYRIALPADEIRVGLDKFGRERSITPTFEFKYQGGFKQASVGGYLTWEPVVAGLWYRGIPIPGNEVRNQNEAAIFMLGLIKGRYTIGYSFDYTLSSLGIATGGAHEVTLSYQFKQGNPKKPPQNKRQIPCPHF